MARLSTGQMREETQELLDEYNELYNWEYNEMCDFIENYGQTEFLTYYETYHRLVDDYGQNLVDEFAEEFDVETGEFTPIADPKPTYYGGDDEAPVLSKNFDDFTRIDSWQEYSYIFVKDRWEGYAISHKMYENYEQIVSVNVRNVEIPEPETV